MKQFYTLICILGMCFFSNAEDLRILFVGNSYTHVNDMPSILKQLAQSSNVTISTTSFTNGGSRFKTHWQNNALKQEIQNGNYDIMILQGQSQEVAFPYSQFQNEVYPYAKKLDSLFKAHNPEGRVIFFMTWGYRYGDANNCPFYPPFCSFSTMSLELCQNYSSMATDFQSELSPIGNAWLYLYEQDSANFDLHSQDNSHPNIKGSYFSACVLYTTIFQTVISSDYYSSLSQNEATFFQQTASSLFANNTLSSCYNVNSSLQKVEQNKFSIMYLPYKELLKINSNSPASNITIHIYNVMGIKVKQYSVANSATLLLNVTDLPKGCYIVQISDKQNFSTNKFTK